MTYKDKVVWLTGASSGIGEAMAYAFAREGAQVILSARRVQELERVRANCPDTSKVTIVQLDVGDYNTVASIVQPVLHKFGRIDVLFNNAGISQRARANDTSLEVYKKIMDVNFMGSVAMTKAVLPMMLQQQSGHIAVISSLTGKFSTALRTGYSASKHALHGFFDGLRSEVWNENISITIICPGFVKTHVSENALRGDGTAQNKVDDAIARGLEPAFVAEKILEGMKSGKEEIYVAGKEMMGVYLKRFLPGVFSKYIRKAKVT